MATSKTRSTLAIAGVITFALSMGISSTAAMATSNGNPVAMSSILATAQTENDLLPLEDGQPFGDGLGLIAESSRSLGDTDTARYWVTLDLDSNVCLVAQFVDDEWSSITCTKPEDFQKLGISSLFFSDGDYAEAYLAPDGLTVDALPSGLEQLDSGLITGDSRITDGSLTFSGGISARGTTTTQTEMPLLHPDDYEVDE